MAGLDVQHEPDAALLKAVEISWTSFSLSGFISLVQGSFLSGSAMSLACLVEICSCNTSVSWSAGLEEIPQAYSSAYTSGKTVGRVSFHGRGSSTDDGNSHCMFESGFHAVTLFREHMQIGSTISPLR